MSGEGIGSVVAEKCSPSHSSSKPSWSASNDFSVSSSSVLQNARSGGWTGIMNIPSRMHPSGGHRMNRLKSVFLARSPMFLST